MGSQCKRVLRALERHPEGICSVDFLLPNVVDGGPPITRLAARIKDLRDQGESINVDGERYNCAVYKLSRVPVKASATPPTSERESHQLATVPAPSQTSDTLFELAQAPRSAVYDDPDLAA